MQKDETFMSSDKIAKLFGLALFALLLFTFPFLEIFGRQKFVFGIPFLYLYIFVVWLTIIVLVRQILK